MYETWVINEWLENYVENLFVSEPIWVRARIKPTTSTVDSCFVLFGTRQYGVESWSKQPAKRKLFIILKVVTQYTVLQEHENFHQDFTSNQLLSFVSTFLILNRVS